MSKTPGQRSSGDDPLLMRAASMAAGAADTPTIVLDLDMRIRGVNTAYEAASLHRRQDIVGELLFDVFPDDPDDPQANGSAQIQHSVDNALRDRATDSMPIYRYDIRDPQAPDTFIPRLWSNRHSSVHDGERQYGILEQVVPITTYDGAVAALSGALASGETIGAAEQLHLLAALASGMRDQHAQVEALTRQADQLSRALESRDIIGQAKGMLMERYSVGPVQAFELLKTLSQNTNVKLEQLARQFIESEHPGTPPVD